MQRIFRTFILVREKIGGIQHRIAQILEHRAVKLVGAALGNDADLAARAAAELRRGHAGLHRKLLNRVRKAEVAQRRVDLRIDYANAVEQEHIGLGARPRHVEAATLRARRRGQDAWG